MYEQSIDYKKGLLPKERKELDEQIIKAFGDIVGIGANVLLVCVPQLTILLSTLGKIATEDDISGKFDVD